jgi:hypothetical protein
VRTGPDNGLVTTGTQQAPDLIGRVLLEPGDHVAVEEPGYPPARLAFVAQGAKVTGVPVDAEGLLVDAIPPDTRAVYVTPAHQFPLGMPMSLRRRTELLRWARRHGAALIEDDYDSEFRFGGRPVEKLQSLDRDGHVIYVGSFSKVMLPSLRVGFLVAPAPLRTALRTATYTADWHTAVPTQAALARFVDDGLPARHVRRMQHTYADPAPSHHPDAHRPLRRPGRVGAVRCGPARHRIHPGPPHRARRPRGPGRPGAGIRCGGLHPGGGRREPLRAPGLRHRLRLDQRTGHRAGPAPRTRPASGVLNA